MLTTIFSDIFLVHATECAGGEGDTGGEGDAGGIADADVTVWVKAFEAVAETTPATPPPPPRSSAPTQQTINYQYGTLLL